MCVNLNNLLSNWRLRRTQKPGQSLVEFGLISVILFAFLTGIIDVGRLLLTYSVVSNAAQEGTRYAEVRPRDVMGPTDATAVAANITLTPVADRHAYTQAQVVTDDASCSIFAKSRERAFGVTQSAIKVAVWYDRGDDTPIPIPATTATPYLETAAVPGNRVVVETSYHFDFIVPYMSIFIPNGINVKMRAARTIMGTGDAPNNCTVNYTPAPTYTPSATFTSTSTATATPTPTPACALLTATSGACRLRSDNQPSQWQTWINIMGYVPGDQVTVSTNGVSYLMTCTTTGYCTYSSLPKIGRASCRERV